MEAKDSLGSQQGLQGQLTLRGIIIGCIGCAIITAASVYTALKIGALPWPIVFAAIVSLFTLKALGNTNLHEANVTHTIMSAGAMVAGGLAFTIPGIWIITQENPVSWLDMLMVAFAGVLLGLVCTGYLRRHFVEEAHLEYPIGEAAAQTLISGNASSKNGRKLFGSMAFAGVYTALRDWFAVIPTMLLGTTAFPGVTFGIYNSPMLLSVGFIVGGISVAVWFLGAVLGWFGIVVAGPVAGLWDTATGQGITQSLGMGIMMGCGIGVLLKEALRFIKSARVQAQKGAGVNASGAVRAAGQAGAARAATQVDAQAAGQAGTVRAAGQPGAASTATPAEAQAAAQPGAQTSAQPNGQTTGSFAFLSNTKVTAGLAACVMAAVAVLMCMGLHLGPVVSVVVVLMSWVTCAMAAQSVGQTGIDPMEIFGLIVLLLVAAFSQTPQMQLFFIAAVIAVACGLAGDVMNDFHAGYVLQTNPQAQWLGQAVGGVVGAVVAVAVLAVLVQAYGPSAFGAQGSFVAAQASVVASMVSGIPCVPAFVAGLVAGCVLFVLGLPVMMLGLGFYLPFYMSLTAFLGAVAKFVYQKVCAQRRGSLGAAAAEQKAKAQEENGLMVASGFLGGESVVGVLIALVSVALAF